ncbi:tyrosyl-DNA phosphodiesterase 2 [Rhinolophus ferrumequinum]|uniref:Tyrosyl-DNA phosphodiesterase 2 n=3 Tax=Rhinolophus ferrumequinum TaxID=59479 RepID=A0A671ERX0_RHIFE|nr:tyrosyl-DNA phosphodiesterase 2 isoform X1 [Rhinolophus ferrumequinum]KAF6293883.1 tyrosyl-DNA phosphodiesterase 2 [Rhinolophus ferrumequinum]
MAEKSPEVGPEAGCHDGEPMGKKRHLVREEFASVASCDASVAWRYLDENNWEMQRALNAYFERPEEEGTLKRRPESEPGSCVDLTNEETTDSISSKPSTSENPQQEDGSMFSLITWNIDGLDLNNLRERAQAVCSYLALYSPDVIFLQEVIPPYYSYLKKRASSYEIITGHEEGYFTAIMLKKSRVKFKSQEIILFPNTKMMRNLLCVHASVLGNELCLMTSHLESTRGHTKERMNQLKMVLKKMQEAPESASVVFAGDTNLRDQEVTKCGGLPNNILDVWEFLGKPKHCQYTWDTQMNSNLGIPAVCKHRFDRIFFRAAAEGSHIIPQSLDLLGLEKLDCGRFPSDHWGLLCNLDIIL